LEFFWDTITLCLYICVYHVVLLCSRICGTSVGLGCELLVLIFFFLHQECTRSLWEKADTPGTANIRENTSNGDSKSTKFLWLALYCNSLKLSRASTLCVSLSVFLFLLRYTWADWQNNSDHMGTSRICQFSNCSEQGCQLLAIMFVPIKSQGGGFDQH
jgi:hypothetical protein